MSEQSRKQWDRAREILEIVEALPPSEQSDAITKHCGDDAELRGLVIEQLNAAAETKGILDRSFPEVMLWRDSNTSELPPSSSTIGPFRILEEIGEGGMGVVYKAEQEHPRRIVALKVIRRSRLSSELIRRFRDEADALGRLQHPGIARIYEVGTTGTQADKQPYFAMEFIEGEPLTEYASVAQIGIRGRLELLIKICDAVHYAHLKGVIHRDLKPANILVDDIGQPKVLDFGVARIVDADADGASHRTELGQLVGTLHYMSPEQAAGDSKAVDNRSDVYSLGVLSYELLSERLPLEISGKRLSEALNSIQHDEPARLSSIDRRLRGDIETIVGKALEKDPARRYQSASDFASDIRRYLNYQPIEAKRASAWYQFRKFTQRNKAFVGGTALVFVALAAATALVSWQYLEATRAREQAEAIFVFQENQFSAVDPEKMGVRLRNDVNDTILKTLRRMSADVSATDEAIQLLNDALDATSFTDIANDVLATSIFEPTIAAINNEFPGEHLVRARLLQIVAVEFRSIGMFARAVPVQREALAIRQRELGAGHRDTLASMNEMATLHWHLGEFDEAEEIWQAALAGCLRLFGEQHEESASVINNLGALQFALGKHDQAESYFRRALDIRISSLGEDHPETIGALNNLGTVLRIQGKLDEANELLADALEMYRRVRGNEHPETLAAITNMGVLWQDQRRFDEAEPLLREVMETSRRILGNGHPSTLGTINNFGIMLREANRLDEAEPYLREAMQGFRTILDEQHPDTVVPINNMVALLRDLKRYEESAELGGEAVALARSARPLSTLGVARCVTQYGLTLIEMKRFEEAESLLLEAHDIHVARDSEDDRGLIDCIWNLAHLYDSWNKSDPTPAHKLKAAEWHAKLPEDVQAEYDRIPVAQEDSSNNR